MHIYLLFYISPDFCNMDYWHITAMLWTSVTSDLNLRWFFWFSSALNLCHQLMSSMFLMNLWLQSECKTTQLSPCLDDICALMSGILLQYYVANQLVMFWVITSIGVCVKLIICCSHILCLCIVSIIICLLSAIVLCLVNNTLPRDQKEFFLSSLKAFVLVIKSSQYAGKNYLLNTFEFDSDELS